MHFSDMLCACRFRAFWENTVDAQLMDGLTSQNPRRTKHGACLLRANFALPAANTAAGTARFEI
jgi:hypothetical protein